MIASGPDLVTESHGLCYVCMIHDVVWWLASKEVFGQSPGDELGGIKTRRWTHARGNAPTDSTLENTGVPGLPPRQEGHRPLVVIGRWGSGIGVWMEVPAHTIGRVVTAIYDQ